MFNYIMAETFNNNDARIFKNELLMCTNCRMLTVLAVYPLYQWILLELPKPSYNLYKLLFVAANTILHRYLTKVNNKLEVAFSNGPI